ncbi:HYR domain-containing protein [Rathayibacter sp. Leaf248]|uniref:HYR domain-containing protein n=1 Tax=Rathayibacter sp. Leaf248 TaxID=2876555 RepID=UPI001E58074A|nr:HYR domain-containing protein [Rathayibacter sp. Leaf248]
MRQSILRSLVAAAVLVAGAGLTVVTATPAAAAPAFSTPCFSSSTIVQQSEYTVPAGVGTVRAVLSGQNGQSTAPNRINAPIAAPGSSGGRGSTLTVEVAVTPGQVLQLGRLVGAPAGGGPTDFFLPGGAGGDAQYLSTVGADGCQHALAVAGGGGGGGGTTARGGDADTGSGATGGENGGSNRAVDGAGGGGASANSGGGAGAAGYDRFGSCADGSAGRSGAFLNDGDGGTVGELRPRTNPSCDTFNFSGGGGGAGWFYGGGGGSSYTGGSGATRQAVNHPGAGGGGSSYVDGAATRISQTAGPASGSPVVAPVYDTAVTVSKTPDYSTAGQEVVITARATVPALSRPAPAGGIVEVLTALGTTRLTIDANGEAVLRTRDLPTGWNDVRAHYPSTITSVEAGRESWSPLPALRHEVRVCAPAPVITRQPADIRGTTKFPYMVTLGVSVSPVFGGMPTVTWQSSRDDGRTWTDVTSRAGVFDDGTAFVETGSDTPGAVKYRATLTTCGGSVVSQPATVSVMGTRFDLSTLPPKIYGDSFDISGYAQAVSVPQRSVVFVSRTAGTCSVTGSTVTVLHAGVCTIAADLDQMTSEGYAREVLQSFTAGRRPLTVTANSVDHPRGSPAPAFTCRAPFIGSDTWITPPSVTVFRALVSGDGDVTYRAVANWQSLSFTSYVLRCSGGTVSSDYTIDGYRSGTLTIVAPLPVVPKVTADSPTTTYGQTPPTISGTASAGLTGSLSCGAYATGDTSFTSPLTLTASTTAGRYTTHCSGLSNPGGALTVIDGVLTVSRASVTVTASSPGIQAYGTPTAPRVDCTTSGLVGSDRLLTEPVGVVLSGVQKIAVGASTPVGGYVTQCEGGAAGADYVLTTVPGAFSIADRTAPVLTVPGSVVADATSVSGAVVTFASSAQDATDGAVVSTCAPASGSTFAIGDTTVDCSAVDAAGNVQRSRFTVTVTRLAQSVAFTSEPPAAAVALGTVTPTATGGESGNPVVLRASGSCAVDGAVVVLLRGGDCTITADQAGDGAYAPAQASQTFTVAKAPQALVADLPTTAEPGSTLALTATATSGLPVAYSAFADCTVDSHQGSAPTVTFAPNSRCGLRLSQPGDEVYAAADDVVRTISVGRFAQTITFTSTPPERAFEGQTYTVSATGGGSSAPVTFSVDENGDCTLADDVVSFSGDGSCTITADQQGDERHSDAPPVRQTIIVGTPEGNLAFGSDAPRGASAFETYRPVIVPGPSTGVPTLTASGACSVTSDGSVRNDEAGLCRLRLEQPGDGYWPARVAFQSYSVALLPQTLTFTSAAPAAPVVGSTYTPIVTGGTGPAPFLRAADACEVADGVVTFTRTGLCTVTAHQDGDAEHESAPAQTQTIEVRSRTAQELAFTSAAPAGVVGGATYTPTIRAGGSSAPVRLDTTSPAVCSVSSGTVAFLAAGTCELTADQAGDATHDPAPQVTQQVRVSAAATPPKKAQTLAFTTTMPSSPERGIAYPVAAAATSALPVRFLASGSCTLTATGTGTATVRLTGSAACTVRAAQAGDATWRAAPSVAQTLQLRAGTRADLTVALAPRPGLPATAPLAGTITVRNVGTRDAATTTTRVVVTGTVASAPGAVRRPGTTKGTTVLTWTAPRVSAGQSITYTVTLADRPTSTTIEARTSTALSDPTPANNMVKRTIK